MTSKAIMSNDINNVIASNTNVSKKSESVTQKRDSFSKVMEKNNYENHDNHVVKHEKSDFHSSSPKVISNKNIKYIQNNQKENMQGKVSFTKEQFVLDIETTINDIANAYKETLDISDEELISIMEDLAINIFQLPLQDLAKDIVLAANGENDITALLVNENALIDLQSMNQFFDKYDAQTKLDMPIEELQNLVNEAINNLVTKQEELLSNVATEQNNDVENTYLEQLTDTELNIDSSLDVNKTEQTNGVKLVETVRFENGNELKIEVVDLRNNMTKMADLDKMGYDLNSVHTGIRDMFESEKISNSEHEVEQPIIEEVQLQDVKTESSHTKVESSFEPKLQENKHHHMKNLVNKMTAELTNDNEVKNEISKYEMKNEKIQFESELLDSEKLSDILEVDDTVELKNDSLDIDSKLGSEEFLGKTINKTDGDSENSSFENSSENDFTNDSANETFYDKFITNLEKSVGIDKGELLKEVSNIKEMQEIVNQVVDKIKIHISKESTTMKLNLNPEHLGRVELEVTSKSGVLTADFVVENETAKEALEKGLPALIEKFNEQGLKVEAVEVRISDYDFTRQDGERKSSKDYGSEDKKKKRAGKITMDELDNQVETIQEERKVMSNLGIDYSV